MSPTTFDDGVTLTMSPNISLTVGVGRARPRASASRGRATAPARLQVGVLAARHLVHVDLGRAGAHVALEGGVLRAHRLPVDSELPDRVGVEPGVALVRRSASTMEPRLGCEVSPLMASMRGIHRVHAGLHRRQHARGGDAGGVVGVEVDRHADLLLQRLDQRARGARLEQARHVLDAEDVAPARLQLLRHRRRNRRGRTWRVAGRRMSPV